MQKTVLTFGVISGIIMMILGVAHWIIMFSDGAKMHDMESGMIWGYVNMIIAMSMVFFGVRQFRDRHLGGKITFGKAFVVGLLIALIGAAAYVIAWLVFYETSAAAQAFPDQYVEHMRAQMVAEGLSAAEISEKTASLSTNMETYKNNVVVRAGMTVFEILPVVILVPFISALILKRRNVRV